MEKRTRAVTREGSRIMQVAYMIEAFQASRPPKCMILGYVLNSYFSRA